MVEETVTDPMEYERIHKVQSGIISPSKLRMKLTRWKKEGSNSNSARTSPSKIEDSRLVKNSLLPSKDDIFEEQDLSNVKIQHHVVKGDVISAIHPLRIMELDENVLDYDSNASSSSFEFHTGDRYSAVAISSVSQSRSMPSKWNDAEIWIMTKKPHQNPKKTAFQNQTSHLPVLMDTVVPEHGNKPHYVGMPTMIEVSMRDMGTEMTPVASQEPSRTTTPQHSPTSSAPSTPRRGVPRPTPFDEEEELKLKTRREIVALGVQLGKMNIAAWASKEEPRKNTSFPETSENLEELERIEYGNRAAAWEEVEKSNHDTRYKRKQIAIRAWESQQKVEIEAKIRRIEVQIEQMKAKAHAKVVKKIAATNRRSEEKRAAAEARKNREAERTASRAEYIRRTGKLPPYHDICCGWFL